MSSTIPLEMIRGDDQTWEFTVTVDDVPVDISGGLFRFTAKHEVDDDDADAVIVATSASSSCVITDAVNGVMEVRIPAAETAGLSRTERLWYDLQLYDQALKTHTVARGPLDVYADVSVTAP